MAAALAPARRNQFFARLDNWSRAARGRVAAYFCMEYALQRNLPIYGGGLGVLAGDTVKSAANLGDPTIAVGLLYRNGYFTQEIKYGRQHAQAHAWDPSRHQQLIDLDRAVEMDIAGRRAAFRLWGFAVEGGDDRFVPLIMLDSCGLPNPAGIDDITLQLYNADPQMRLRQEMALGIGGMRALHDLGVPVSYFHLNEGHAAFAPAEYLRMLGKPLTEITQADLQAALDRFSFTTHTPVPAGFDKFLKALVRGNVTEPFLRDAILFYGNDPANQDYINMALLAMRLCGVRNGVSQLHAEVSEGMFPDFTPIFGITNGIHPLTWVSPAMAALYDKFCPEWSSDPTKLAELAAVTSDPAFRSELWSAHQQAKTELVELVNRKHQAGFDPEIFTIGFARRFAGYKRGNLLLNDQQALLRLADEKGGLQIVFAGKAHPNDGIGQGIIQDVIKKGEELTTSSKGKIKVVFLADYDLESAKILVAGSDIWLNNPIPPQEASGTSGMKAAINGVPHVSTWDGWWVEGAHDDATGWTIGERRVVTPPADDDMLYRAHLGSLLQQLRAVMTAYYGRSTDPTFVDKMAASITFNGAFFNTHRMWQEYRARVFSPTRLIDHPAVSPVTAAPKEDKLIALAGIGYRLARAADLLEADGVVAEAMLSNLSRAVRVTRYEVHNQAVHISRRWSLTSVGRQIVEDQKTLLANSGFVDWRQIDDFQGEVMADVLRTGQAQMVVSPEKDPRCFRDGKVVSKLPFVLVPEIVNGVVMGVYKLDFEAHARPGGAYEEEFIAQVMSVAGLAKSLLIGQKLALDLSRFTEQEALINWALTLMTAGGFVHMPRYAVEANRVAFFRLVNGELSGALAIGEAGTDEWQRKLGELGRLTFAEGMETFFRALNPAGTPLDQRIRASQLGPNAIFAPIAYRFGTPEYDRAEINGHFDARKLSEFRAKIEQLFSVDGRVVDEFVLLPVRDGQGNVLGLIYADNAFSGKPMSASQYQSLVEVFGRSLGNLASPK